MISEGATREAATELWKKLATEGTPESSTASGLSSRLQSERLLNNLDDVYQALEKGRAKANVVANEYLDKIRKAMGIAY